MRGLALACAFLTAVSACGAGRDATEVLDASLSDARDSEDGRTPSTPNVDGGTAGAGGGGAVGGDAQAVQDAPADGFDAAVLGDATSSDAPADGASGDSVTCPATSTCDKNKLSYYVPGKFFCSLTTTDCKYGCRQIGSVAECAPSWDPGPCSQVGVTSCDYRYYELCFDDAASACACAGCGASNCQVTPVYSPPKKGRLKLPFKLPKKLMSQDAGPPPVDAASQDAATDATLVYSWVTCSP